MSTIKYIYIYKGLTKVLTKRLEKTFDENQPREQAGFRNRYSTTDHIHVVNPLKEKCREHNIPLCIAFVDSVQTQAVLIPLQELGIEDVYIEAPEGNLHQQLDDSPSAQRKQQD